MMKVWQRRWVVGDDGNGAVVEKKKEEAAKMAVVRDHGDAAMMAMVERLALRIRVRVWEIRVRGLEMRVEMEFYLLQN
ncbi:hypothetical protein HYC85_017481 [Camellia sinensis]|uniref:Uncharacterized protein n=1 Tax=Camellia sinensis TaxID=4442 RepID=A0A7J7GVD6_CAMSI|nr:hypothetical protein HYC85_017481 [Camellia sinensis]